MSNGLILESVTLRRSGLRVCQDVSLIVPPGEITVLLGMNGAGKTTLLDGIAGILPAAAGTISLDGQRLDTMPAYRRTRAGLAYSEQGRTVFSRLTVAQNIAVVDRSAEALDRAFDLFPRLAEKRGLRAGLLSGGEQQMLMISRALATRPRVLLVDELSLGLAPRIVHTLMRMLPDLTAGGTGILLVEQFAEAALGIGTTAHIMQRGQIVRPSPCSELLAERSVRTAPDGRRAVRGNGGPEVA